jgi:hypothetical protein
MKILIQRVNIQHNGKNIVGFANLLPDGSYIVKTIFGIFSRAKSQIFAFFETYFINFKF